MRDAKYPPAHVSLLFLHMFFGPAWLCIEPCSSVLHVLLFSKRTCQTFFVLLEFYFFLLPPSRFEIQTFQSYKAVVTTGIHSGGECDYFCIEITSTVKKSNPATEPHRSPQGCTVRPRKGAGQSSMGGGRQ
jgi:hypothetical protein